MARKAMVEKSKRKPKFQVRQHNRCGGCGRSSQAEAASSGRASSRGWRRTGTDPAAVLFDALKAAKARSSDVLIVDTAGRLHNKANLMAELEKMKRVAGREVEGAPHETLLVLDATTGQNGLLQAGFSPAEISKAFDWLDALADQRLELPVDVMENTAATESATILSM